MSAKKCISDADLGRLLEGDAPPSQRQALQQHIETCPRCKSRWQKVSAGAQYVETLLSKAARKAQTVGGCLSEDLLAGFVSQMLDTEDRRMAEEHLAQCTRCRDALAGKFAEAYEKEGDRWWSEYVGQQILGLLTQLPEEEINLILKDLNIEPVPPVWSEAIIKLPILEPPESEDMRLAAATGAGFSLQTLRQEEPAFEFKLVQFGEQLRITAKSVDRDSPYEECLASVRFYEGLSCLCSQVVLIERGEARCIFEPEEVRRLKPKKGQLTLKLVPIVTLEELKSAGSEAYMPILSKLLKHREAKIRRSTIEVIARICGPQAHSLVKPLLDDEDEMVRTAAEKALRQFPEQ